MLAAALVIGFLAAAVGKMMTTGLSQQALAREYSKSQTDLRSVMRKITRTVRHGGSTSPSAVGALTSSTNPASSANFGSYTANTNRDSDTTQIIVKVPQSSPGDQIRVYRNSTTGNIYAQTQGEAASNSAGTLLAAGPSTLTIAYYKTTITPDTTNGGLASEDCASSTAAAATEAKISISLTRSSAHGSATVAATAYVLLRNEVVGL